MNAITNALNSLARILPTISPLADRLGLTLLHTLWQGLAIALLLIVAMWVLRQAAPQVRYILACAAMALFLASALTTFLIIPTQIQSTQIREKPQAAMPAPHSNFRNNSPTPIISPPSIKPAEFSSPAHVDIPTQSPAPVPQPRSFSSAIAPWLPTIALLWAVGIFLLSTYRIGGWLFLSRLIARAAPSPAAAIDMLNTLRQSLRVTAPVRLLQSARVNCPCTVGWLRPVILVPLSILTELPPDQLQAILAHELAHIRRHDYLVNLLQTAIETLLFYHPATWWISRQIRNERENCCDDIAAKTSESPVTYARALASLEEMRLSGFPALAASGGPLLARIRRILDRGESPRPAFGTILALLLSLVLISLPLATRSRELQARASSPATMPAAAKNALEVRCINLNGIPVADAQVYLLQYILKQSTDSTNQKVLVGPLISDSSGQVEFENAATLATNDKIFRRVYARLPGEAIGMISQLVMKGDGNILYAIMQPAIEFHSRVSVPAGFSPTDVTVHAAMIGAPVSHQTGAAGPIALIERNEKSSMQTFLSNIYDVTAKADGTFVMSDLPAHGTLDLIFTAPGLAPATLSVDDINDETHPAVEIVAQASVPTTIPATAPAIQPTAPKPTDTDFIASSSFPQLQTLRGAAIQLDQMGHGVEYKKLIDRLTDLGINTISLAIAGYQENTSSTQIDLDAKKSIQPSSLASIINYAKSRHLHVVLIPYVFLGDTNDPNWAGRLFPRGIGTDGKPVEGEAGWNLWFNNYRRFINLYAQVAQDTNVDIFSVGAALVNSEQFKDQWIKTIAEVRSIYKGKLTYCANWDHYQKVPFWDQLDLVAMNSYWDLSDKPNPSVEDLKSTWGKIQTPLFSFLDGLHKQVLFTELGWCSLPNAARDPWDYTQTQLPADNELQNRIYESFFESWFNDPHLAGFCVWNFHTEKDSTGKDYTPMGKPAEQTLRNWLHKAGWVQVDAPAGAMLIAPTTAPAAQTTPAVAAATNLPTTSPAKQSYTSFRVTIGADGFIAVNGAVGNWQTLRDQLGKLSAQERANMVIKVASETDDLPVGKFLEAQAQAAQLVKDLGLAYVSIVGVERHEKVHDGTVYVAGDIQRNGAYHITGGANRVTVKQQILAAGVAGPEGVPHWITLTRSIDGAKTTPMKDIPVDALMNDQSPDIYLQPGDDLLVSAKPGPIPDNPTTQPISSATEPAAATSLEIHCVDTDGKPVANAQVYLLQILSGKPGDAKTDATLAGPLTADAMGRVEFKDVATIQQYPSIARRVFARVPGKLIGMFSQFEDRPPQAYDHPTSSVTAIMYPAMMVQGIVKVPPGRLATDVRIHTELLASPNAPEISPADFSMVPTPAFDRRAAFSTDAFFSEIYDVTPKADGTFVIGEVPANGMLNIIATGSGLARTRRNIKQSDPASNTFTMTAQAAIHGRVTLPDSTPAAGIKLRLAGALDADSIDDFSAITDADGHYSIDHLPGTRVFFNLASTANYVIESRSIDLTAGVTSSQDFQLQRGTLISGLVTDSIGKTIPDVVIFAMSTADEMLIADTTTDDHGRYTIRVPSGSCRLDVSGLPPGYARPLEKGEVLRTEKGAYSIMYSELAQTISVQADAAKMDGPTFILQAAAPLKQ